MDDCYVMHLKHRTDRWEQMLENWSPHFNLIPVSGVVLPDDGRPKDRRASEGLGLSHMELLKDAKARGLETILIMEDDAVPEPKWFERWTEIKAYLDSHLDRWEVFNGGVHFLRDYLYIKELKKSCLIDGQIACASHFIYLNLRAFDKFMRWTEKKIDIDMFYCNNHTLYCSYPILAKQSDGVSDITQNNRAWEKTYLQNEFEFRHKLGGLYLKYQYA